VCRPISHKEGVLARPQKKKPIGSSWNCSNKGREEPPCSIIFDSWVPKEVPKVKGDWGGVALVAGGRELVTGARNRKRRGSRVVHPRNPRRELEEELARVLRQHSGTLAWRGGQASERSELGGWPQT